MAKLGEDSRCGYICKCFTETVRGPFHGHSLQTGNRRHFGNQTCVMQGHYHEPIEDVEDLCSAICGLAGKVLRCLCTKWCAEGCWIGLLRTTSSFDAGLHGR